MQVEQQPTLSDEELTYFARIGCGGDNVRWSFSEAGLRRTLASFAAAILSRASSAGTAPAPIDMMLFCPQCGLQHVDAPETHDSVSVDGHGWVPWTNPPHKSHLCHRCGHIWRPADVPTNGVLETKTRGAHDSFTSMLGAVKTPATFNEFFDREYPDVEDRQGRFRNSNGYQLCWRGWEAATERAVGIVRGLNNHDNPMTANDCADEIAKGLEP